MIFQKNNNFRYSQDMQSKRNVPSGIDFRVEQLTLNLFKLTAYGYGEVDINNGYGNGSIFISPPNGIIRKKLMEACEKPITNNR